MRKWLNNSSGKFIGDIAGTFIGAVLGDVGKVIKVSRPFPKLWLLLKKRVIMAIKVNKS